MSVRRHYRIGQVVPSSNVTMETEVPAMIARARVPEGVTFSFHASRAPMKTVSLEELTAMNGHMQRCTGELLDARMDVIASACLVAIMCQGEGYHRQTESTLQQVCRAAAADIPVITSAGALIHALRTIGAARIALIAPYMKPLADQVVGYIEAEGIMVVDYRALEIPDNLDVAAHDPMALVDIAAALETDTVDAVVLSACVQMPSLAALDLVQQSFDVPVLSTAAATVFSILRALGLPADVPGAGRLLSGAYH